MALALGIQDHPLFPKSTHLGEHLFLVCLDSNFGEAERVALTEAIESIYKATGSLPAAETVVGLNGGEMAIRISTIGYVVFGKDVLASVIGKA